MGEVPYRPPFLYGLVFLQNYFYHKWRAFSLARSLFFYSTNYLRRLLGLPLDEILSLAEKIWNFLSSKFLLIENRGKWKLDHERLFVINAVSRYVCNRCGIVTAYSARQRCTRKGCEGKLETSPFNSSKENIIARWVADKGEDRKSKRL